MFYKKIIKIALCIITILTCFESIKIINASSSETLSYHNQYPRVKRARETHSTQIKELFKKNNISYPAHKLLIRAFKYENELELWAQSQEDKPFVLIKQYPICVKSGNLGPKRKQGDYQVPEGFYKIIQFNPWSSYHLSFKLNYPNKSDQKLSPFANKGGDIFIHGNCVTIGCIPLGDTNIEELYIIALDTFMTKYPVYVHIFPMHMNEENWPKLMQFASSYHPNLIKFWENIRKGYSYFEKNKKLPNIQITNDGYYSF